MTTERDMIKSAIKSFCKINQMRPQITRFTKHDGLVTISLKNHADDGVDTDCFKVMNFIFGFIGPRGITFSQTLFLFPDSQKIDRITISFQETEYEKLVHKLLNGEE